MAPTIPAILGRLVARSFWVDPDLTGLTGIGFVFGDGTGSVPDNAYVQMPVPWDMKALRWHARIDIVGDATFAVKSSSGIAGAVASVGGTQPSITAARGAELLAGLDWTTQQLFMGDVLEVTVLTTSPGVKQVTLVVSGPKGIHP